MTKAPDDLVERPTQQFVLRAMAKNYAGGHCWDHLDGEACEKAADEIERLRSQLAAAEATNVEWVSSWEDATKKYDALKYQLQAMRKALEPFALRAEAFDPDEGDDEHIAFGLTIKIGWLRAAREALRSLTEGETNAK